MENSEHNFSVYCQNPGMYGRVHQDFVADLALVVESSHIGGTGDRLLLRGTDEQRKRILELIRENKAPFTATPRPRRRDLRTRP